jgi:hypothetical protein
MGQSQSTFEDLKAMAIQVLVAGAKALLTEELSKEDISKFRSHGGILRAAFDDEDYKLVDTDTDNFINVEFNKVYGYQFLNKYTNPPNMLPGTSASSINDFVVANSNDVNTTQSYITGTFTALLNDQSASTQVVNVLTQNVAAMTSKGNTDWETLKQQFYVPDHTKSGKDLLYQFDMLSVYATAEDNQGLVFVQYISVYYRVDPDSLHGEQRDMALAAVARARE